MLASLGNFVVLIVAIISNSSNDFVGDQNVIRDIRKWYVNKRMTLLYLFTHVSPEMSSIFSLTVMAIFFTLGKSKIS